MMKRIVGFLLMCLMATGCAFAEGQPAQEAEVRKQITTHFCETTGFPAEDARELLVQCEFLDQPSADSAIPNKCWIVGVSVERCGGLLNAAMDYVLTQDGTDIVQESSVEDFKERYEAILRVEPVLEAQQSAEKERGPFRDWPAEEQQAFVAEHGDISEALSLLQCPSPEDLQYWEIDEIARAALLKEGYEAEDVASYKSQYCYSPSEVDWMPVTWRISFYPAGGDAGEARLAVEMQLDGLEVTCCAVEQVVSNDFFEGVSSNAEMEAFAESF